MENITLTEDWSLVVSTGANYLIQPSYKDVVVKVSGTAPTAGDIGFSLTTRDTLSSLVYPASDSIWARAKTRTATITVDTWI